MPDRFSISRIFQITPMSTPGITHALTTATRAASAPSDAPAFGGVEQPGEQQAQTQLQRDRRQHEDERDADHAVELRIARRARGSRAACSDTRSAGAPQIGERDAHQLEHRIEQEDRDERDRRREPQADAAARARRTSATAPERSRQNAPGATRAGSTAGALRDVLDRRRASSSTTMRNASSTACFGCARAFDGVADRQLQLARDGVVDRHRRPRARRDQHARRRTRTAPRGTAGSRDRRCCRTGRRPVPSLMRAALCRRLDDRG